MVKKYMRAISLCIAAVAVLGSVSWITHDKLTDLRAERLAEPYEFISLRDRERQLKCMTDNIYYEAAMEPAEGKIAVAQIVMNRVASGKFPQDPCQVIYQKNVFYSRVVCQFTWYCDGSVHRRPIRPDLYEESRVAAKMVMLEGFRLPGLRDALFYHADYVNPQWRLDRVGQIGRHIFYRPRGDYNAKS
jgi:spore germination cell wall hydrolase CwlJ-like protein